MELVNDLSIRNARVVFPWGTSDVPAVDIAESKVVSIGEQSGPAHRIIDADGLHLLPGFIDTHVHLNFLAEAENAEEGVDEIRSETGAAALSGVTTALVYYRRLDPYGEDLVSFIEQGLRSSFVDFGIHLGILIEDHLDNIESLSRDFGILSFKMYTCYKDDNLRRFGVFGEDDGFMLSVLERAARISGAQVHVHCENDEIVNRATAYVAEHEDEYANPTEAWSAARPPVAEAEAVRRVSFLARAAGCRLFIPHVSSAAALDEIRDARTKVGRQQLLTETCPQYLLLSAEDPPEGTNGKVNPPIRRRADSEQLIEALAQGEIDVMGTDHATTTKEGKEGMSVVTARPGFPGMATLFPAVMTLVKQGRLPIENVARVSLRAAEIFALEGKGVVAPGFDADLVLVDPDASRVVRAGELGSASDFSVFEGRELYGWPAATVVGGRVVAENSELVVDQPSGRYLRRTAR